MSYRNQDDSLLSIINKLNFNFDDDDDDALSHNFNENCQIKSWSKSNSKYLLLIEEFFELFLSEMTGLLSMGGCQQGQAAVETDFVIRRGLLKTCLHLFEKFYLICTCSFDSVLTLPYLKYFWTLLNGALQSVREKFFESQNWSLQLHSLTNLFTQNLHFDDSTYKVYYDLWLATRPPAAQSLRLTSAIQLESTAKLNAHLVLRASLIDKQTTSSKMYSLLKHLYDDDSTNCCHSQEEDTQKIDHHDSALTLRKLFITRAQLTPLKHYLSTLQELFSIDHVNSAGQQQQHQHIADDLNFCHSQTKSLRLGQFYALFKKMSRKCFNLLTCSREASSS
jgi:hypothetical protein